MSCPQLSASSPWRMGLGERPSEQRLVPSAVGDLESRSAGSPALSESPSSLQALSPGTVTVRACPPSPGPCAQEEPQETQLKTEKPDSPPPAPRMEGRWT